MRETCEREQTSSNAAVEDQKLKEEWVLHQILKYGKRTRTCEREGFVRTKNRDKDTDEKSEFSARPSSGTKQNKQKRN